MPDGDNSQVTDYSMGILYNTRIRQLENPSLEAFFSLIGQNEGPVNAFLNCTIHRMKPQIQDVPPRKRYILNTSKGFMQISFYGVGEQRTPRPVLKKFYPKETDVPGTILQVFSYKELMNMYNRLSLHSCDIEVDEDSISFLFHDYRSARVVITLLPEMKTLD